LLESTVNDLTAQLERARKQLSERSERDRSPRRLSASTSHARLSATCSALNQVRRWERDAMLEERDAKIAELQATVKMQNEEIERSHWRGLAGKLACTLARHGDPL